MLSQPSKSRGRQARPLGKAEFHQRIEWIPAFAGVSERGVWWGEMHWHRDDTMIRGQPIYTHTPVDPRLFDPRKAKDPKDPDYRAARRLPSIPRDADIVR